MSRRAVAALLLAAALPAAAAMYKVVGADGKISYVDTAPSDARQGKVTEFKVESYTGPAQVGTLGAQPDWAAILRRPVSVQEARASLVMYSTQACGYCRKAKQYMQSKGIAYSEIDVGKDARGKEEYQRLGGRGVPFFVVGGRTMTGFAEAALDDLLRAARP